MVTALAIAIVSGLLWGTGHKLGKHEDGDDRVKMQGVWRGLALEIKGDALPPPAARSMRIRFDKDTFTIEQEGVLTVQGRYTIDSTHTPKTIDLTITETVQTVNKGSLVLGVYALEKDQLRLCTTKANGQERPKKLVSNHGTTHTLITFQKEKP
ncbi:MAG: TIGR03067 domain-containing protein [Gemmataceae bacterium]